MKTAPLLISLPDLNASVDETRKAPDSAAAASSSTVISGKVARIDEPHLGEQTPESPTEEHRESQSHQQRQARRQRLAAPEKKTWQAFAWQLTVGGLSLALVLILYLAFVGGKGGNPATDHRQTPPSDFGQGEHDDDRYQFSNQHGTDQDPTHQDDDDNDNRYPTAKDQNDQLADESDSSRQDDDIPDFQWRADPKPQDGSTNRDGIGYRQDDANSFQDRKTDDRQRTNDGQPNIQPPGNKAAETGSPANSYTYPVTDPARYWNPGYPPTDNTIPRTGQRPADAHQGDYRPRQNNRTATLPGTIELQ